MARKRAKTGSGSGGNTASLGFQVKLGLAIRGIVADFGPENADRFRRDLHPDLRADTPRRAGARNPNREATWRVFCEAKDNSSPTVPSLRIFQPIRRSVF
jgi:hypothetical protein